jgi:hypothetical protein
MVLVGSGIVLGQEWGPLVLAKGLVAFPVVFVMRGKIKGVMGRLGRVVVRTVGIVGGRRKGGVPLREEETGRGNVGGGSD